MFFIFLRNTESVFVFFSSEIMLSINKWDKSNWHYLFEKVT